MTLLSHLCTINASKGEKDVNHMLIKDILEELKRENVTVGSLAKTIDGISEKPLRNALKAAGYEYSNQAPKGWGFIGEGEEPLDKSIFDYAARNLRPSNVKRISPSSKVKVNTTPSENELNVNRGESDSPIIHTKEMAADFETAGTFSPTEIADIKKMLREWQVNKEELSKMEQLHDRIKHSDSSDKQRRTIVIDRKIGAAFDNFCKEQRFNKSDIIELAMLDFIEKYS